MGAPLDSLIVKLAAPCNLDCTYCYVYNHEDHAWRDRPKHMPDDVFDAMLERTREYCTAHGSRMSFVFHGGEPTLVGAKRFDELVVRARRVLGDRLDKVAMQTNGTLLDDEWATTLKQHHVSVGVSIDGPAEIHDRARVDHAGRGSHADVVAGIRLLQRHQVSYGVICVIDPTADGAQTYRYLRSLDIRHIHFLLPHVSHDNKERFYGDVGARTPIGDFLVAAFDEWLEEDDPNVQVLAFWGLLRTMMGGPGWKDDFGNPLTPYLIVETDGAIEALDSLKVCDHGINHGGGLNVLRDGFEDLRRGSGLLHKAVHEGFALCAQCRECPEAKVCGGGYLPARYSRENGFDNPTVWCEDIYGLLQHIRRSTGVGTADDSYLPVIRAARARARTRLSLRVVPSRDGPSV